ncbi:MAG: cytochrome c oxidase subunit II [Thermoleophilaceae bacterium]
MPRPCNRRLLLTALAAALFVLLALAPVALGDAITPESGGSPNADDIDALYKIALYIAIVVFLVVEGTLIWSLVKHRARRGGEAAQIRGNVPLELGWTVGAALILVVLTVITFVYLNNIEDPAASGPGGLAQERNQLASVDQATPPKDGGPTLNVKVNGQQYIWRYVYPGGGQVFTYYEMVVPTNTTVTLDITSSDVAHSWWIPKLGGKADAIPGHVNHTWFKIDKPGIYGGQCAELCGINHADMRARVRAVPPSQFDAWARRQRNDIQASQKAVSRQREQRLKSGQVD